MLSFSSQQSMMGCCPLLHLMPGEEEAVAVVVAASVSAPLVVPVPAVLEVGEGLPILTVPPPGPHCLHINTLIRLCLGECALDTPVLDLTLLRMGHPLEVLSLEDLVTLLKMVRWLREASRLPPLLLARFELLLPLLLLRVAQIVPDSPPFVTDFAVPPMPPLPFSLPLLLLPLPPATSLLFLTAVLLLLPNTGGIFFSSTKYPRVSSGYRLLFRSNSCVMLDFRMGSLPRSLICCSTYTTNTLSHSFSERSNNTCSTSRGEMRILLLK